MIHKDRHWALIILLLSVLLGSVVYAEEANVNDSEIDFLLEKQNFVLGEPIWVSYTVRNNTGQPIQFVIGNSKEDNFVFSVSESPSGRDSYQDLLPYFAFGGLSVRNILKPGDLFSRDILMTEYIWLKEPGQYHIKCEGKFSITANGRGIGVSKNTGSIEFVIEKDEDKLFHIVSELVIQLRDKNNKVRTKAARSLSTVRHALVLDYLRSVLDDKDEMIVELALKGIYNVGNAQAKDILSTYGEDHKNTRLGKVAGNLLQKIER